jgi:signal transduction histidine kinase
LYLFRIVEERLQNRKKHSETKKAQVNLRRVENRLCLSVRDEGRGFDANMLGGKAGLGIRSMQGRARLLCGEFEIHSKPGNGTRIEVWVPLKTGSSELYAESAPVQTMNLRSLISPTIADTWKFAQLPGSHCWRKVCTTKKACGCW